MSNSRKPADKGAEKREKEFCGYWSGANRELASNIRRTDKSQGRSKSRNSRKQWEVEGKPENVRKSNEEPEKITTEEAPVKRERRGWGIPRPNQPETRESNDDVLKSKAYEKNIKEDIPDYSDRSGERGTREDIESKEEVSKEEEENEEIRNFITSMKDMDIQKLRQSMKEDEVKKAIQDAKAIKPSVEKHKMKAKQDSDDIEEEINEDIDENPLELEQESVNKTSTKIEPSYYGGKPISVRKARPISATYGLTSSRQADPIFSGIPSYKAYESKKQDDTRSSITQVSNQPAKFASNIKPAQKTNYEEDQGIKGAEGLLKRIEGLDDKKKQLLENILDKIEKGTLSKEYLLSLEFLNIKKNNEKKNQDISRHEESKRQHEGRREKQSAPSKQELTLSSSVESKITKITQQSRGRQEFQQERGNNKHGEDYMSPIREEEMLVERYTPLKEDEIKEVITGSPEAFHDSLDDNQYASRIKNEKKYHSNVEKIHVPETLKIQQPTNPKKETTPTSELRINDNKGILGDEHQIQFRIMSTWGSVSNAGLTEVQIFDENGDKIDLKASAFSLKNCGLTSIKNIGKIVDGVVYTIEEDHMWVCAMPAPPTTPEITMTIKADRGIGGFRIWNYNKSLIESIKGIKELEIIHNRTIVWFGIINRGPGNEYETYHTEVILKKGLVLPPVEVPTLLNPDQFEGDNVRKFSNEKQDVSADKSSSVPIWLQDTHPRDNFPMTTNLESQGPRGSLSRRDYEKSAPVLTLDKFKPEPKPIIDKVQNQSQELKLEAFGSKNQVQDLKRASEMERPSDSRNANRVKAHPKTNSPFKDILDDKDIFKKSDEKTPKAGKLSESKENMPSSSSKKDDNSSINSVEFFNITNFGRLKPAKRESLVQVLNLQQDVLEKIKDVQKRLDFRSSPIREEGDILTQFDKGLKEEMAKPKSSLHKAGPSGISSQKEEHISKRVTSAQINRGQQDSLDSMINKGSSKGTGIEGPGQVRPTGRGFYENRSFRIPELPRGRVLKFSIYSTWGDAYYIGLNGIEMFNEKGEPILLEDIFTQIRADPSDINCLPGYGKDPRTVDKLVDGTYLTCDDLHVWLAPFTHGKEHIIEIDFREVKTVSMIRIWNYNKSRIHSYRGAKDVAIRLDDTPIFFGEVAKAPGSLKGAEDSCEYILFTENDAILSKIDRNDWLNRIPKNDPERKGSNQTVERPMTGTKQFDESELRQIKDVLSRPSAAGGRPLTMAKIGGNENKIKDQIEKNKRELKRLEEQEKVRQENEKANVNKAMSIISSTNSSYAEIKCKSIVITITKSWGDSFYVGLTGLEIYDGEGNKIPIQMKHLNAKPRDMNSIPGYTGDTRTLDKLINGINVTTKDENMWLIPYTPNQSHCIYINFDEARTISGIRVWNYNKSEEGSYRGSKCITVSADGIQITPPSGVILKKAPGTDYYDFSQFIPLPFFGGWDEATTKLYKNLQPKPMQGFLIQEYDTPEFPTGFLFKIKLLSTWGDYNYIGLNGIELYDQFGEGMLTWGQKDYKIAAEPSSVSCLPGHEGDIRTIDKLVNGDNETFDDRNMWLAPYLLERRDEGVYKVDHNEIVIMFDKPRIISCIKFWNYAKSPERGVRELEIFCDDSLLYRGYLKKATSESESKNNMATSTSVLFTKDKDLIRKIEPDIYTENGLPQKVILNNEKKVVNPSENRPQTHVPMERPTTSVKGLMNY